MGIQYLQPLDRSWDRARRMLFRPFRLEFWLVLGFAAFLANLGQTGGSWNWINRIDRSSADAVAGSLHDMLHTPWILWGMGILVGFGFVLGVVFTWLSARGNFVFLDGVLHERARIAEPWRRFGRPGDSLFVLNLILSFAMLALLLLVFGSILYAIAVSVWNDGVVPPLGWGPALVGLAIVFPFGLAFAVFQALTRHFVVPIMWKYDLGVVAAWGRFWPLLAGHPGEFFVYLILLFLVYCGLTAAIFILGICTCCVGVVLLAIPYVGSVALLPALVTIRGFGPEFLAQFGPEWDTLPLPPLPPVPPLPSPPPAGPSGVGPAGPPAVSGAEPADPGETHP